MSSVTRSLWAPVAIAAALVAAVGLGTPADAADHVHTGSAGKPTAEQLAEPAVVRVETGARLDIVVHSFRLYIKTYEVGTLTAGTGFIVDPSGTVVTAASAVKLVPGRAEDYGINRTFHDLFGVPLARDPYARTSAKDPKVNTLLQSCYGVISAHDNCKVFVTPVYRVYPFVVDPGSGVLAQPLGGIPTRSDVALLTTNVRNSPTESLSDKPLSSGPHSDAEFVAIGYPTKPARKATTTPTLVTGKLLGGRVSPVDAKRLVAMLGDGLPGTPVVHTADGDVLGMLTSGAQVGILPASTVRSALSAQGADARSSEVDTAYAAALSHYNIKHYSAAVGDFNRVLALSNGNALANQYLNVAKGKAGTKEDVTEVANTHEHMTAAGHSTGSSGSRSGPLLIAGLVLLGLLLVVAGWLFRRRRQRRAGPGGETSPSATPGVPVRPAESPTGARRVPVIGNGQDTSPRILEPTPAGPPSGSPSSVVSFESPTPAAPPTSMIRAGTQAQGRPGRHCTQCGDRLGPTNRFCGACGSSIG